MEGILDSSSIKGRDTEYAQERRNGSLGPRRPEFLADQIMDCGNRMGREQSLPLITFDSRPYGCAGADMRLTIEKDVQHHVGIHQNASHLCFESPKSRVICISKPGDACNLPGSPYREILARPAKRACSSQISKWAR